MATWIQRLCVLLGLLGNAVVSYATELPRVDRCRVVYVHEFGTRLAIDRKGGICLDRDVHILNDPCRERYAQRAFPFPCRRLRALTNPAESLSPYLDLQGIDSQDRPWFMEYAADKGQILWTIERGRLRQEKLADSYYSNRGAATCQPNWPWVGKDILGLDSGALWVAGKDSFYCLRGGLPQRSLFPTLEDPDEQNDLVGNSTNHPYWQHQMYYRDDSLWLVRDCNTNCRTPGSFVLRETGGAAVDIARFKKEFVSGLVFHQGDVYLLLAQRQNDKNGDVYVPSGIQVVHAKGVGLQPEDAIRQRIADLDNDDFAIRDAASTFLGTLSEKQLPLLRQTLQNLQNPEQRLRLEMAIRTILSRKAEVAPAELAGMAAGKLLFVDSAGRQYVQPWKEGKPLASLQICNGQTITELALPSANVSLDCLGEDGFLYGHDEQTLFVINAQTARCSPLASLGDLAGREVRMLAVSQGLLCLGIKMRYSYQEDFLPVWLKLDRPQQATLLAGTPIATGLPPLTNDQNFCPVALGPDNHLWFVHGTDGTELAMPQGSEPSTSLMRIGRADGAAVQDLGEPIPLCSQPNIWPLSSDSALVVPVTGNDKVKGVCFYDSGSSTLTQTLAQLLEQKHQQLSQVMKDGAAFVGGDYYDRSFLVRLGDTFYLQEETWRHRDNGVGSQNSSGCFRDGNWLEKRDEAAPAAYQPIINRLVGVDVASHRLLGFQGDYKELRWIPLASDATGGEQLVDRGDNSWAFYWVNHTPQPRFEGAWMMTPQANEKWQKIHARRVEDARKKGASSPDFDVAYQSDDFASFQSWTDGKWQTLESSLYGGEPWTDRLGNIWHFRVREAMVHAPGGRQQLLPLDAGIVEQYRLTIQSSGAVWITTQNTLCLYVLQKDKTHPGQMQWTLGCRFALPQFGVGFAGPWVAGDHFYYVSDRKLYHLSLRQLLASVPTEDINQKP